MTESLPEPEYVVRLRAELGLERTRVRPFNHQVIGVKKLLEQPVFALFDTMGLGKTKQVIDASMLLYLLREIDRVVVVAPASVRAVWFDPDFGELKKHLWDSVPCVVEEFHARSRTWFWTDKDAKTAPKNALHWTVTNYDFIRNKNRLAKLMSYVSKTTLLVLDESSAVKNYKAEQTKSVMTLRKKCGRVVLLNGTPIENNPGDMFSQGRVMDPHILECDTWFHFRAKYAVLGGYMQKQVVGWRNIEDIQRRFAPYVLRRLKDELPDLPPKLPAVTLTCALNEKTWSIYREMRDEMVAWLSTSTVATSAQAAVKGMRLAQITTGFLGGLQEIELDNLDDVVDDDRPSFIPVEQPFAGEPNPRTLPLDPTMDDQQRMRFKKLPPQEIGREKLDFFCSWLEEQLTQDPNLKLLAWCRFRPELARIERELLGNTKWLKLQVGTIHGGQKKHERASSLRLLDPRTAPSGPVVVLGTPGSGAKGLNLAACHTCMFLSNDFKLGTYLQALDRVHRPGQTFPVSYFDLVATGPTGQKTIDHIILKARQKKEDVATFTTSAWISALKEE